MMIVDMSFPVVGERVPRDHGYALYGAVSRVIQSLHGASWLGIHPLGGTPVDPSTLELVRRSQLRLRLPADRIGEVLPLVGARLDVSGTELQVGSPTVHPLVPSADLDARLVAIKLTAAPRTKSELLERETLDIPGFTARYTAEIQRQLERLGIATPFELRGRRSVTVGGRRVVGFSVRVLGLSADQSIALQEKGLGGKRRMGCGLFRGTRGS